MKLDRDKIRELHGEAVADITQALEKQERWSSQDGARKIGYTPSAELAVAVGAEEADRLQYRAVTDLGDLLHNRDEFVQNAEGAKRDLDSAIAAAKGGRGSINSLGVLQSRAPRIDVLAATFSLRYDRAVESWHDVLCAVEEARQEEGFDQAVETLRAERERERAEARKANAQREKERKAKLESECEASVASSSKWGNGHKCTKKHRFVFHLEDGSTFRMCGTHRRSSSYKDEGAQVGDTIYVAKKGSVRIAAIEEVAK